MNSKNKRMKAPAVPDRETPDRGDDGQGTKQAAEEGS